jgi:hypothetical protein
MKTITILLSIVAMTGCTTFKETTRQAKLDWNNFNKTIRFNLNKPAVYPKNYF